MHTPSFSSGCCLAAKVMMEELRKGEGVMTDEEERKWKKDFVTVLNHLAMRDAKGATLEQKAMSLAGLSEGGESHVSRMTESMLRKMEAASEQRSAIESGARKRKEEGGWDTSTNAGDVSCLRRLANFLCLISSTIWSYGISGSASLCRSTSCIHLDQICCT